jgi:hypothetical protein
MDIFYIFVKTNVLQSILHELNQIDTFYDLLFDYINKLKDVKFVKVSKSESKDAQRELNNEQLNLNKTHLTLLLNYYCCFEHSFDNLAVKTSELVEQLNSIGENLNKMDLKNIDQFNIVDIIEWQMTLDIIDIIKLMIDYSNYLRTTQKEEIVIEKEKHLKEKLATFYSNSNKLKLQYPNWILAIVIQFYFDVFFKHLESQSSNFKYNFERLFLRDEFFIFNMNICYYHFNSYNVI